MKNQPLLRAFIVSSIPLLVIGLCAEAAIAQEQEQTCIKVGDADSGIQFFSVSANPANDGWTCKLIEGPQGSGRTLGMRDLMLNVNYFDGILFQTEEGLDYWGNTCFQDYRQEYPPDGVMTGTLHISKKKGGKDPHLTHFTRGYDIFDSLEVFYHLQLVEGQIIGNFPLYPDDSTEIQFELWKIETEGKGKLKGQTCVGSGQLPTSVSAYITRCSLQNPPLSPCL